MIAVIFEVWLNEGRREEYLALAAELREALLKSDGFISIERFESLYDQGKLLSLQFWRDEESVRRVARKDRSSPRAGARAQGTVSRLPAARRERDARLWNDATRRRAGDSRAAHG